MTIRVTVEPEDHRRARIKGVDEMGRARIVIASIPRERVADERNQLLDRLAAGGEYGEVTGEAMPPFPDAPELPPVMRRPGDKDRP
jgi:hypothetical protein